MRLKKIITFLIFTPIISFAQPNHPPTPICFNGISVSLSEDQPTPIHARSFDANSFDDFTPKELLRFSYTTSPSDSTKILTCPFNDQTPQDVTIYVTDTAGQSDFCVTYFEVNNLCDSNLTISDHPIDTLPPIGIIQHNLSTVVNPLTGYIHICAYSFDASSHDNQSAADDLIFSFSRDTTDRCITLTCLDAGQHPMKIYITDEAGNQTHATSYFTLPSCDSSSFDTTAPTINCLDSTLQLMGDDPPVVELESIQLIDTVSDNGTPYDDLAFSGTAQDTVFQYHCIDTNSIFDYSFQVSDLYGNTNSCMASVQVEDPEGICRDSTTYAEGAIPSNFEIYPNPVGELLQIKNKGRHFSQAVVRLISMDGHVVLRKGWLDAQQRIELETSFMPGGLYILEITTHSGRNYRDKIIIRNH